MSVAIIGAGISGLTAAYRLRSAHGVTVFESDAHAGGHADTAEVSTASGGLAIDTGFIVYNRTTYPGFTALLRELDVPTQASEMSFSCTCRRCGLAFSSRGLSGLFADRRSILRASHWALLAGLERFYRDARRAIATDQFDHWTIGSYVRSVGARRAISKHYLLPMAAGIWSCPPEQARQMPFAYFVRFLANHGLIGWGKRLRWRTIAGGSREYVRRLVGALPDGVVRTGVPVGSVRRDDRGALVTAGGREERYDAVVLACHADEALRLLADATPVERAALGPFRYTPNRAVLHTDGRARPAQERARASWNVVLDDCRRPSPALTMTYDMNRLQALPGPATYCVSVNPGPELEPGSILAERWYTHPQYTLATVAAQHLVARIQGERGTYYAGAHLGYGFHEDGYQSGARAAALILARR